MNIVDPSFEIIDHSDLLATIEKAGRTCWRSEDKITDGSAAPFIERIRGFRHNSVLEHGSISARIICDRGVLAELTRHRIASFSVESSRYCNYGKDKFGAGITVIRPSSFTDGEAYELWVGSMYAAEACYLSMLKAGCTAQQARAVLPLSLKTELVMTANPREWAHVFALRCHRDGHPDMLATMVPIRDEFARRWPVLFASS